MLPVLASPKTGALDFSEGDTRRIGSNCCRIQAVHPSHCASDGYDATGWEQGRDQRERAIGIDPCPWPRFTCEGDNSKVSAINTATQKRVVVLARTSVSADDSASFHIWR